MQRSQAFLFGVLLVGCISALLVAVWRSSGRDVSLALSPNGSMPDSEVSSPPPISNQRDNLAIEGSKHPEEAQSGSGLTFIQNYWGDRWPEARQEILDLYGEDALESAESWDIPPFEAISSKLRDSWFYLTLDEELKLIEHNLGTTRSSEDLKTLLEGAGKSSGLDNLKVLETICADHEPYITELMLQFAERSDRLRRRIWDEGSYYKAPGFAVLTPPELVGTGPGFSSQGTFEGWTYAYFMSSEKDPEYGWAKERLREAVRTRDATVKEAIESL